MNSYQPTIGNSLEIPFHRLAMVALLCAVLRHTLLASAPRSGPLTPEASLEAFQIAPGLRVELVAAEPLVVDPVDIAFDEDGRLWVVEMRDYPNGPAPGEPPASRIRVLDDRDGDGRFDRSRLFADRLLFANGVLPCNGGALVTASGEIVYLKDTDGDGRADVREVLFRGFAEENPQLRVNHPTLGLDNWVYVANGLRGGSIVPAGDSSAKPVSLSGMDFRFDPRSKRYEAISGMGQFGLTFDDWGNRFVCSNRNHNRHMVLPDRAIRRNPFLAVPDTAHDTPLHGAASQVFPLSRNWTTSTLHTGTFTAACGVTVYRGNLLPEQFHGNSFTCEPTGNLVHRDVLEPDGATFRARRARENVEFLASPDEWFRPVNLANGPDGALYVVDMCRAVIEHPQFMPPELKERPDLHDGKDRGRIWRVVPDVESPPFRARPLSKASTEALVGLLAHPGGWWRETAQRLLVERQDARAVDSLRFLIGAARDPRTRLHAAWTLEGLDALDANLLLRLLVDEHPHVREHAVRLAATRFPENSLLRERILALAGDPDPRVRFQVALEIGEGAPENIEPLASIALRDASDRWTRLAVASAVPEQAGTLVATILSRIDVNPTQEEEPSRRALVRELSTLVGSRQESSEVRSVLDSIARFGYQANETAAPSRHSTLMIQIAALNGLAEGTRRRGKPLADLLRELPQAEEPWEVKTRELFRQASDLAIDPRAETSDRRAAIELLASAPNHDAGEILAEILHAPTESPSLRADAVRALARRDDPSVSDVLLKGWKSYGPAIRPAVADAMTQSPARVASLLDAVEAGTVLPAELGPGPRQQLQSKRLPEELRSRASRLIADTTAEDRSDVIERYRAALELEPDPAHGRALFEKTCATCHRVAGIGVDVGPDIADSRTRTPEALLVDLLNPNRAIDANYVSYTVATLSGRVLTGVIASETASSVTLRRAENQTDVVLRQDIDEMRSNGVSLMPVGLEKDLTVQDVADLIGFLKNWRYVDGQVELGAAREAP